MKKSAIWVALAFAFALTACGSGKTGADTDGNGQASVGPSAADGESAGSVAKPAAPAPTQVDLGTAAIELGSHQESRVSYLSPTAHFRANATKSFLFTPTADGKMRIDFDIINWKRSCVAGTTVRYDLYLDRDDHKVGEFKTFGGFGHGRNTLPLVSGGSYRLAVSVEIDGRDCAMANEAGFDLDFVPTVLAP